MIVVLIILLILGLVVWGIVESVNLFDLGSPPKDSDILEMLEKYRADYDADRSWNDKFILKTSFRLNMPNIHQTTYSIILPYYISDVGVVPIWYKSAKEIEKLFKDKIAKSSYTITKREKLGLK